MEVFLSELAESKLLKLNDYLIEKWGARARDRFFQKLDQKISQISSQPESCPQSTELKGLYKCVVTKQSTFFYRSYRKQMKLKLLPFLTPDKTLTPQKQTLNSRPH